MIEVAETKNTTKRNIGICKFANSRGC